MKNRKLNIFENHNIRVGGNNLFPVDTSTVEFNIIGENYRLSFPLKLQEKSRFQLNFDTEIIKKFDILETELNYTMTIRHENGIFELESGKLQLFENKKEPEVIDKTPVEEPEKKEVTKPKPTAKPEPTPKPKVKKETTKELIERIEREKFKELKEKSDYSDKMKEIFGVRKSSKHILSYLDK